MKKAFILIFILLILSGFFVMAKGNPKKLQSCEYSENLFGVAKNKHSGYETLSYFSFNYEYLGMEQYDGEGNLVIGTFEGTC